MTSLLLFIIVPDFYNHKEMLTSLRFDNMSPRYTMFNNIYKSSSVASYVPPLNFSYEQYLSSNLLINLMPLAFLYGLAVFMAILNKILANVTVYSFVDKLAKLYPLKIFMLLFILTVQEEFMIVLLQFRSVNSSSSADLIGLLVAAILSLHMIYMIYKLCKLIRLPNN